MLVQARRELVERTVAALLEKHEGYQVLGLRAAGPWDGPQELSIKNQRCGIRWCPSSLAVRAGWVESREEGHDVYVFLTEQAESDLGADLLARIPKRRLTPLDPWESLLLLYGATGFDRRLSKSSQLVELVLQRVPHGGLRPSPTGFLEWDAVWQAVLQHGLGFPEGRSDLRALLEWTGTRARESWQDLEPAVRSSLREVLEERSGPAAAWILQLVESDRGEEAVPLGLVARLLVRPDETARVGRALLERDLGRELDEGAVEAWAVAAEAVLEATNERDRDQVRRLLHLAETLVERLKASPRVAASRYLGSGLQRRLEDLGKALSQALAGRRGEGVDPVEAAAARVLDHWQVMEWRTEREWREPVRAAVRLLRWWGRGDKSAPDSFPEAARSYLAEGGFVDWARAVLHTAPSGSGAVGHHLGKALVDLLSRVQEAREKGNARFGELLADWWASDGADPFLVPVERILETEVAALAEQAPVLLLVMDGMAIPVFHALMNDIQRSWGEWAPAGSRRVGLAPLPTVTAIARTSLLSGTLQEGDQQTEKREFTAHPALRKASLGGKPPVLFHKGEISNKGGVALSPEAQEALESPRQRVVGIVLNAIDDNLLKGDQIVMSWSVASIKSLGQVLESARTAGRAVVFTADHGHISDRGTEYRSAEGAKERSRLADAPASGEVRVKGRRVVQPGNEITVPWSEGLRYSSGTRSGYHGGASPQEVLVPLAVLVPEGVELEGWANVSGLLPTWWEEGGSSAPAASPAKTVRRKRGDRPSRSEPQIGLFDPAPGPEPAERPPAQGAAPSWIQALLDSAVFISQRDQAGPMGRVASRLPEYLEVLSRHGGRLTRRAFARATNLRDDQLQLQIAAMERLLNVDGFAVIRADEETIELDRDRLREQFELGEAG